MTDGEPDKVLWRICRCGTPIGESWHILVDRYFFWAERNHCCKSGLTHLHDRDKENIRCRIQKSIFFASLCTLTLTLLSQLEEKTSPRLSCRSNFSKSMPSHFPIYDSLCFFNGLVPAVWGARWPDKSKQFGCHQGARIQSRLYGIQN